MEVTVQGTKRTHGTMVLSRQVFKEDDQKEELNGKTDQSNEKKVPVLTISLRPGEQLTFTLHSSVCFFISTSILLTGFMFL